MDPANPPETAPNNAANQDFQLFFESAPGLLAILLPNDPVFTVVAATEDFLKAGRVARENLIGRGHFEVFPDSPEDPGGEGQRNVRASFRRVMETGKPDRLSLQRYDVARPDTEGGGFEERYWSASTSPIYDREGRLAYLLHAPEEITHSVLADKQERERRSQARAVESKFRELAESSTLGILITDLAGGISYLNPALQQLLGYSQDEAASGKLRWDQITPPEFVNLDIEAVRQLKETGRCAPFEKVYIARDGRWIPILLAISMLETADGRSEAAAFVVDLTDRKRTEREAFITTLEEAIRALAEPEEIIATGMRMMGEYCGFHRCAYCSFEEDGETFSIVQDYTAPGVTSMKGRYTLSMFGPDCVDRIREGKPVAEEDIEGNARAAEVWPNYRKAGIRASIGVPLFKAGRLVSGLAVHQQHVRRWRAGEIELVQLVAARLWETIERGRATTELQKSESRLRLAQHAGRIGIFDWVVTDDHVTWTQANDATGGNAAAVFEGKLEDWSRRVVADDADGAMRWIRDCVAKREPECLYEYRALVGGGEERWVRTQAQFFYSETGEPLRMVGVNIDIHAGKQAETHLRQQWNTFDIALSNISDFVYVFDLEGRFTYINQALLSLWGKTFEEAYGKNFFDLEYPEDLATRLQAQIQQVIDTRQPVRDQTEYTAPSGDVGQYEYIFVPVLSGDQLEAVAGSTRDITERSRIQQTIEEDRRRWRELLYHAPASIAVLRGPEHVFEWVNSDYERLVGRAAAEVVGRKVIDALPEVQGQVYIDLLNGVYRTGKAFAGHEALIRFDQGGGVLQDRYLNFVYLPTRNLAGEIDGIFYHGTDVTDMVESRQQVEANEKRFRTLVDSATDHAIIGTDLQGLITHWNSGAERLLGFSEAEIMGQPGAIIFTREDRETGQPEKELNTARLEGSSSDERWHVRKDESRFWGSGTMTPVFEDSGIMSGFVKVFQDRSREWAANEALRDSEERFRQLANSMPQIVWTARPDGAVDYFNDRWYEFSGFDRVAAPGTGWNLIVHPDDAARAEAAWGHSLATGEIFQVEKRFRDYRESRWRWFIGRALPVRDASGRIVKWFGTCTDIDEQKAAQQAVLHAQKLESIGLLAGGIAHDFNNLLVGIMGGASFAVETVHATHPAHPLLRGVVEASEKAAHLTRQMLAYAGKGRFFIEPIDLSEMARQTAQLVSASVPRSVQVQLELEDDLPTVQTDGGQMQQVAMNLIINAAEAAGEKTHGLVVVRTRAQEIPAGSARRDVFGNAIPAGRYALLEVQDTGPGIEPATLAKIFDPFFTTKFTGRGLGLAAVLGIARSHQGAIEVDTEIGKGSIFRVWLPARHGVLARKKEPVAPETPVEGTEAILVIDDEAVVRNFAKAALEKSGYSPTICDGGRAGLETIRKDLSIALVLLDMSMPEMSGRQVLEALKSIRPALPVVICSGFSEDEVYREFSGLDLAGVLQKPFTTGQLVSKVRAVLDSIPSVQ